MQSQPIDISFEHGGAYDLFVSLNVLYDPEFYGVRAAWAAGMRQRLPKDTRDTLEQMVLQHEIRPYWLAKFEGSKDCQPVLARLRAHAPVERLALLEDAPAAQQALFAAVAERGVWDEQDLRALQAAYETDCELPSKNEKRRDLRRVLDFWAAAEATSEAYMSALEVYYELFFAAEEQRIAPSLERAEQQARELIASRDLSSALETLSRGVNLDVFIDRPKLLLVPSFWTTPIVLLHRKAPDTRLIIYGARAINEPLVPGEIAPDSLVNVLKALADPTRLAILKYLQNEPLLPSQLAARLRLRPATVSHHLKILRLAGLVFIRLGAGKETFYSARSEAIHHSLAALQSFLLSPDETR